VGPRMSVTFETWSADAAQEVIASIAAQPGPVLRCLQAVQERFGYVPADAVGLIAQECNVSRADVHGVFTFYSDLRSTPPPQVPVRLCAAEACQAVGARELRAQWEHECGHDPELAEATGVDEQILCLGNCALGPAAMVGGTLMGRATVESIVQQVRRQLADNKGEGAS
jgi:formate dehydrogenase subunit gamma